MTPTETLTPRVVAGLFRSGSVDPCSICGIKARHAMVEDCIGALQRRYFAGQKMLQDHRKSYAAFKQHSVRMRAAVKAARAAAKCATQEAERLRKQLDRTATERDLLKDELSELRKERTQLKKDRRRAARLIANTAGRLAACS